MPASRRSSQATSEQPAPELTVDEAAELYHNEWILMRVTANDEHQCPSRGIIVAHRKTRKGIQKSFMKAALEAQQTRIPVYLFFGFRRLKTMEEWRAAITEAASLPEKDLWIAR